MILWQNQTMSTATHAIHFIGVGGIGMSALARHYLHEGWQVSGSDATQSANTEKLRSEGADIVYAQTAENIRSRPGLELVVYTEAMDHDHPELVAARAAGITTVNYFEALANVANDYYLIAVAGTHGKTTTTAMLADILEDASFDPTVVVGSLRTKTGCNYRPGKSKYMLVEACEYKRDFLTLKPDLLVITNLEHEHVDYYQDLADVQDAFKELVSYVPEAGYIIANTKDANLAPVVAETAATVVDYNDCLDLNLALKQPGLYNRQNAAAATAAAQVLGVERSTITQALENFAGTARRFEYRGDVHGAPVYDDYGHHPTEVKAAISGAREIAPDKRLTVVFQSHTYSRTKALFDDFVAALAGADRVYLLPIYAAREKDDGSVNSEMLQVALVERGVKAELFYTHEAAALAVEESVGGDDVVLCLGAGSVTKVADILTK